jgi:hypothetical protein
MIDDGRLLVIGAFGALLLGSVGAGNGERSPGSRGVVRAGRGGPPITVELFCRPTNGLIGTTEYLVKGSHAARSLGSSEKSWADAVAVALRGCDPKNPDDPVIEAIRKAVVQTPVAFPSSGAEEVLDVVYDAFFDRYPDRASDWMYDYDETNDRTFTDPSRIRS